MDRTKISFAEAEGKTKFPAILKWGEVDQRLRSALWTPIYLFLNSNIKLQTNSGDYYWDRPVSSIMLRDYLHRQHRFISDFKTSFYPRDSQLEDVKNLFSKADYVALFDYITFLVRDRDCPADLIASISRALEAPYSPYRLSIDAKTIFPAIGQEQTKALERDVAIAFNSPFEGSKSHIEAALQSLGEADHRAVVRESIHAVESAVRDFTGDPNAVLSKALKSLVGDKSVHKALADAFDKLYAYSSDESGIRHALVFGENEKVGLDEAVFFLSACTAFVGFLSRKKFAPSKAS